MFRIVKRENFSPIFSLFEDFIKNAAVEDVKNIGENEHVSAMALDLVESAKEYRIIANLPGVKKEDINISMRENQLTLSASTQSRNIADTESLLRAERFFGKYQRRFTLPDNCDAESIKAKLDNGVLYLDIPKKEPKPIKEIVVE